MGYSGWGPGQLEGEMEQDHWVLSNIDLDIIFGKKSKEKWKNGVDRRTYKVIFSKIQKYFPGYECNWSVENGIKDMIKKLKEITFSEKEFNNKKFYRLQKLEDLRMKKMINDELIWINHN